MATPVSISWSIRADLSVAQAALVVATGARCVDPKTERLLVESVTGINTRLISASIDVRQFWQRYRRGIAISDEVGQACTDALLAAGCSEFQVEQTAKAIHSLLSEGRIEFNQRHPKLIDQLELRGRPLKDRWNSVGPGLLWQVQQQIWGNQPPARWWPARVEGLLIQPIRGGDGGYVAAAGLFWIEAVLSDIDLSVPEVLRVAYLVTRLAIDRHRGGDDVTSDLAWSLATIPLVLSAGRELELIQTDELPIAAAARLWQLADPGAAEQVQRWWQKTRDDDAPLPIAVRLLDAMLS